jgi:peptidoglycan hydrolase-like protein with peptidoglycan-binding domain
MATVMTEHGPDAEMLGGGSPPRRRRRLVAGAVAVVLVMAVGVLVAVDPFGGGSQTGNRAPTSLASVKQQDLSSQTLVSGTLGYAGNDSVLSQAHGTITALPAVGQIIEQGQMVFEADGKPVVLLYGAKPAYRNLAVGDSGPDVAQLNAALVALGYATSDQLDPSSEKFSAATATALKGLQGALGLDKTGGFELGQAVFLPSAIRVTAVSGSVGGSAGGPILTASSTTRIVTVDLSANQQSQVKVGDQVTITLPDQKTTPGVVFSVGSVATATSAGSTPTVPVVIIPSDPNATGRLDQAPVRVSIVTATAKNAFVVPVNALLALAGGGYAIETVTARGVHRLVPVELGLFDDGAGLVQISGTGVQAGQRVVVPAA